MDIGVLGLAVFLFVIATAFIYAGSKISIILFSVSMLLFVWFGIANNNLDETLVKIQDVNVTIQEGNRMQYILHKSKFYNINKEFNLWVNTNEYDIYVRETPSQWSYGLLCEEKNPCIEMRKKECH